MAPQWTEAEDDLLRSLLHTSDGGGQSEAFWSYQEIAHAMNQHAPRLGIRQREYTMHAIKLHAYELRNKVECTDQAQTFVDGEAAETFNLLRTKESVDQSFTDGGLDELPSGCTEPYQYPGGVLPLNNPRTLSVRSAKGLSKPAERRPFWDTQSFPGPNYGSGEPFDDLPSGCTQPFDAPTGAEYHQIDDSVLRGSLPVPEPESHSVARGRVMSQA